ncbi:chromosome segregation protein [Anatilimnocola aggregata]|uniref:Chromosome segregation protein n=1 Tax=Anatilimnocola aggregata TaxID=2528021 RepID=A0A517Y7R6_9BACT|nr:AAA family ATPase [Anatilimnocola aggregata]QDU26278.1 chromosome segregation protein [Anatilimnocola aggregata]
MAYLAIRRLTYEGKNYSYESPVFGDGLNILEGPNGTGKSTFANLIYFCLGGSVDEFKANSNERHEEITSDENNYVQLLITIDGRPYTLKRLIGTNDVAVLDDDESKIFPITRGEGRQFVFSDWLLGKLGIEPVSINYGLHSGKLNITDFMRLIYHDQAPDPSGIFKAVDKESYVTDSQVFREAIFEILVGKSYQDYYSELAALRDAERDRSAAAKALELFKTMASDFSTPEEELNAIFLNKKLEELRDQQSKLLNFRRELAKAPPPQAPGVDLPAWQRELLATQIKISGLARNEASLLEEVSRLEQLKSELVAESTQLSKMMFAHEELKLFSSNTCPYCLKDVQRTPNKCVCGSDVGEADYEKFFYDSAEYLSILKSRQKNVQTVDLAAGSVRDELASLRAEKQAIASEALRIERMIASAVDETDSKINLQQFEEAEERLSSVRKRIGELEQEFEIVTRKEKLQNELNTAKIKHEKIGYRVAELAAAARADIQAKRITFSNIYSRMMVNTLQDCDSASINDGYMPIVNGGKYTEKSLAVPRRLLYYATLLEMSLTDDSVKFPRFLLIDTPETSGIDAENLNASITRLVEVIENGEKAGKACQVIFTTGIGKRPETTMPFVFAVLSKPDGRLLRPKPKTPEPPETDQPVLEGPSV